jgi:orotate phosphoribosyltransferase
LLQVRKQAKSYGTRKQIEGGTVAGRRLVIVEDIVTSGGQIVQSALLLRRHGATILAVVCVVDREAGATDSLAAADLPYRPLFTMSELRRLACPPGESSER